ncbi:hypothetical protein O181_028401 [Austropuccinia psidii MF-1]|uniref:Uncharacterized protein n=1 Tax=Austropuccinia psidii MF-1 TaxID=1389203 RepID=A0A9Q3CP29_9BASI|nr:hypothetical protein [Austropuccinia psidii MF-1]
MRVPDIKELQALKKLAIKVGEIFPHAAGVEGLFSIMSEIKTKSRNPMHPSVLKLISQIKLGILHSLTSCNKQQTQNSKRSDPFSSAIEYNQMTGYDTFDPTRNLEVFEEGVFGFAEDPVPSRQDAFMETLFDFDLLEQSTAGDEINVDDTINPHQDEGEWDPAQVFSKNGGAQ